MEIEGEDVSNGWIFVLQHDLARLWGVGPGWFTETRRFSTESIFMGWSTRRPQLDQFDAHSIACAKACLLLTVASATRILLGFCVS